MHRSAVKTPIWQMAPISRIYHPPPPRPMKPEAFVKLAFSPRSRLDPPPPVLAWKWDHFSCPFGLVSPVYRHFCPFWGQSLWSSWVFPSLADISVAFGPSSSDSPIVLFFPPFYIPKNTFWKGNVQCWGKNAIELGNKHHQDKGSHFHTCTPLLPRTPPLPA